MRGTTSAGRIRARVGNIGEVIEGRPSDFVRRTFLVWICAGVCGL
ncbi:hypothetical protein FTUN_6803 [Frigoriglobus tundricola]|uniref:Uncharacterized protein n=1 Tax=Frigoriglobus tundricola TaxID=2774151 RepID=A0A6M5Z170_9BACT|nr:hypothetical protein FTUN_6803 [Frigoriglobus tundricola]